MKRVVGDILIVIRSENLEKYMVKKMEQKIIFLDIDGILTEPGKNVVPKSALWAIAQARNQGHYVFLCTGRSYGMLLPLLKLLKYEFDGVIASAGGYIECCREVIMIAR